MDLDLPSLETFVQLAACGSFSDTAKAQGISQPAVSLRIAKLESAVGLRLFIRKPDGIELTRDGTQLIGVARKVLIEHESLCSRMNHFLRESRGGVRVCLDASVCGNFIATQVEEFEVEKGSVEIVRPNALVSWDHALLGQQVDFVVTGSFLHAGSIPGLRRFDLETQRGITIAWNRAYFDFDVERFNFPEALRSTILIPSERLIPGYRPFLEKWCMDSYGVLPPDMLSFDDEEMARDACCVGLGVMIFPGDAELRMELSGGGLGVVKTFEFLLPDAYSYSIFLRVEERNQLVLRTALKLSEVYHHLLHEKGPAQTLIERERNGN
jgi:DNA-binding transcriptional LysR family regulator